MPMSTRLTDAYLDYRDASREMRACEARLSTAQEDYRKAVNRYERTHQALDEQLAREGK